MTASEIHSAVERAIAARLATKDARGKPMVNLGALRSFIEHGARYCFPVQRGSLTRGVPTSHATAPLKELIVADTEPVPVWPHKDGAERGMALYPLFPSVPEAALRNPALHEMLALFDAVRGGSARERALALELIDRRLQP